VSAKSSRADETNGSSSGMRTSTVTLKRKWPKQHDDDEIHKLKIEQLKADIEMKRLISEKTRLQIGKLQSEQPNNLNTNPTYETVEQMLYVDEDDDIND
jgi:hypothetical protein